MSKFISVLNVLNVPAHISNHLIGKNHTIGHQQAVGASVMVLGVTLTKIAMLYPSFFVHVAAEVIGYSIHGIGLIPFVHQIDKKKERKPNNKPNTIQNV